MSYHCECPLNLDRCPNCHDKDGNPKPKKKPKGRARKPPPETTETGILPIEGGEALPVRLQTADGRLVKRYRIPAFVQPPDILQAGLRFFVFSHFHPPTQAVYREAFLHNLLPTEETDAPAPGRRAEESKT